MCTIILRLIRKGMLTLGHHQHTATLGSLFNTQHHVRYGIKREAIETRIGPSVAVQTVSDSRRPLFSIFFFFFSFLFFFLVVTAVAKTPEGVVVGFQIFAWAPK